MIALMLLSLILGITAASTFMSTVKTQTRTDDLSKARAAAEALLEKLLLAPNTTLSDYIDANNCGSACTWQVTDTTGQVISAIATLSYAGNSGDSFTADLETTNPFQVNLLGYTSGKTIDICWNTPASIYASYIKDSSGTVSADAYAYNSSNTSNFDNGFSLASAKNGYTSCFTVTADNTPKMLRLRSYYLNTAVVIIPQPGEIIPKQGVLIISTGTSGDAKDTVTALKTTATLPALFDYAILQKSEDFPLSNVTL